MFRNLHHRKKIMKVSVLVCLSALAIAGFSAPAYAGAAPEEAIATLQKRGYTAIEIVPDDAPGYVASACKGGNRFGITMDRKSNIIDVDPRGSCTGAPQTYAAAPPPPPQESIEGYKGENYGRRTEPSGPAVAHAPIFDELYRRGYYDIRVIDQDDDEIEVLACKGGRLYEIEIKFNGRIDDIDKKGRCKSRRHSGKNDTVVDAPFTGVRVGRGKVDVEAPFTGVHVGRRSVHIRAPFVNFTVPR